MKIVRKYILLIVVLAMVLNLFACGPSLEEPTPTPSPKTDSSLSKTPDNPVPFGTSFRIPNPAESAEMELTVLQVSRKQDRDELSILVNLRAVGESGSIAQLYSHLVSLVDSKGQFYDCDHFGKVQVLSGHEATQELKFYRIKEYDPESLLIYTVQYQSGRDEPYYFSLSGGIPTKDDLPSTRDNSSAPATVLLPKPTLTTTSVATLEVANFDLLELVELRKVIEEVVISARLIANEEQRSLLNQADEVLEAIQPDSKLLDIVTAKTEEERLVLDTLGMLFAEGLKYWAKVFYNVDVPSPIGGVMAKAAEELGNRLAEWWWLGDLSLLTISQTNSSTVHITYDKSVGEIWVIADVKNPTGHVYMHIPVEPRLVSSEGSGNVVLSEGIKPIMEKCRVAYRHGEEVTTGSTQSHPWPMFGHDAQNTFRSPYEGPESPSIKWDVDLLNISSAPLISADDTIYLTALRDNSTLVFTVNPQGERKELAELPGKAAIFGFGPSGTLYLMFREEKMGAAILALDSSGKELWRTFLPLHPAYGMVVIGTDGSIYATLQNQVSEPQQLVVLNREGKQLWELGGICSNVAIAPDGTVYVCGRDGRVFAYDTQGQQKWQYDARADWPHYYSDMDCWLAVSPDGTVYVLPLPPHKITGALYPRLLALTSSGSKKWHVDIPVSSWGDLYIPSIGPDGSFYVHLENEKLFKVDPSGDLRELASVSGSFDSVILIDSMNTIYVGGWVPEHENQTAGLIESQLFAFRMDGSEKWRLPVEVSFSSLVMGSDGTIYVVDYDSHLYAIR